MDDTEARLRRTSADMDERSMVDAADASMSDLEPDPRIAPKLLEDERRAIGGVAETSQSTLELNPRSHG